MGPLLFTKYINNVDSTTLHCKFLLVVDDTILYMVGNNLQQLVNTICSCYVNCYGRKKVAEYCIEDALKYLYRY